MEFYHLRDFVFLQIFLPLILFCTFWFVWRHLEYRLRKLPPGPAGLPILGYAPFIGDDVHKSLAELNKKYGNICSTTAGLIRILVVDDYETAKELLSHPKLLERPPKFFDFVPEGGGFGSMNGPLWEQERKFMMQAVKNIGLGKDVWNEIIQDAVSNFVSYLAGEGGQATNVSGPLSEYALSNITSLVFGKQFLNKNPNPDIILLDKGNKTFKRHYRFTNLPAVYPSLLKYFIKFNINGYRQKRKDVEMYTEVIRKEVVKRLNSDEYDPSTDLIKGYLQYSLKENASPDEINRSVGFLVGHLSLFITTADTATTPTQWLMLLMSKHPQIQAKVHKELDEVIGKNGVISWSDKKNLPYSMACIKEMLRWTSVLPIFAPRCASETFEFRGYTIAKGYVVLVNAWSMHRDPKHFKDPEEYIPERFLCGEENNLIKVDGYGPFSFGKRSCPGENITLMILFLFFTGIMQKFTVKTPTGLPPDLTQHFDAIMEPTNQDLCFVER